MKKGLLKQAFAMFMTVTLLVTSVPVTAYASTNADVMAVKAIKTVEENEEDNITIGTLESGFEWTYDADTKTMTITGEGEGLSLSEGEVPVDEAEHYVFEECIFSGSLARLFAYNHVVKTIKFVNCDTTNVTDMSFMFRSCWNLMTLDISNFNTANVTSMSDMFNGCNRLTTLDINNFNTANVTDMSWMFNGCSRLTTLDISNFDTSNVTDMSRMFCSCDHLTTLNVSNFNTENVTNMSNMFFAGHNLTTLDIGNFNTAKVTDMSEMFRDCMKLTSLDVSKFDTGNVTSMNYMFSGCSNLTTLDVSNFNTSNVTDMSGMFSGCSNLTTLNLGNFDATNVLSVDAMLDNCTKLQTIHTPKKMSDTQSISLPVECYTPTSEAVTACTAKHCGMMLTIHLPEYTITYQLNGGVNDNSNPTTYSKSTETIILKNPTRKGYTFAGWYSDSAYKNQVTQIPKGSNGNKTLYARWTKTEYKITYNLNGGKLPSGAVTKYNITSATFNLPKPTRTGYTFAGWYTDKDCKTAKVAAITSGTMGDKTYYAKWTVNKYNIKFNANGGKGTMSTKTDVKYTSTVKLTNKFKRTGYTFAGWATSKDGKVKYKNSQEVSKLTGTNGKTITLYAKWTLNKYNIKFSANGGKGKMSTQKNVKYTSKVKLTNQFTRKGYTFAGWATSKDGKVKYKNKAQVSKLTSTNGKTVTLYAKWTPNKYNIKFNANGGKGKMTTQKNVKYTTKVKLTNKFKRTGYKFQGWATSKNGKVKYKNKAQVSKLTSTNGKTVTLYAVWKKK